MVPFGINNLSETDDSPSFKNLFSYVDWQQVAGEDWVASLLNHQLIPLKASKDQPVNKVVHHLFFEQQNLKKTQSRSSLFLGFPLVFLRGQESIYAYPVYLWPIELRPGHQNQEEWWCQSTPDSRPILNPEILEFEWQNIPDLNADEWLKEEDGLGLLSQKMGIPAWNQTGWQALPKPTTLALQEQQALLYPGAVMSLFSLTSVVKNQEPIETFPLGKADIQWRHHLSYTDLDPTQQAALNHFYENPVTLVTGSAGSGKTHLVKNLVINALSNQKKILLITNRSTTISQVQETLENLGVDRLGYWLRNPQTDADLLPKLLVQPLKASRIWNGEQHLRRWLRNADEFQQFKSRQDGAFRAARTPVFGPMNWAQTLGLYLKSAEHSSRALLGSQLNALDFELNLEEFTKLSTELSTGQKLFEKIGSIRHPLKRLHADIFAKKSAAEALQFTQSKLQFFLSRLERLQQDHIQIINQYERQLKGLFEDYYKKEIQRIENTQNKINNNTTAFGKDFLLTSATSLKLYAPFSERIKTIKQEREKVIQSAQKLQTDFPQIPELELPASGQQSLQTVRQVQTFLDDLRATLEEWHDKTPELVQDHLRRLNYQTTYEKLGLTNQILNLEAALDQTVDAINHSGLLEEEQTQPMLTLTKRQQKIESLIEYLETIQINLRDFQDFYHWQAFWIHQDKISQEMILAIIRSKSKNWQQTFEAWYLQQLLQSRQSSYLQEATAYPGEQIEKLQELRQQLPEQINFIWENSRQEVAKRLKKTLESNPTNDSLGYLQKLFAQFGKEVTQSLPILIATPEQAISYFEQVNHPIFDGIIFESAQFIDAELGNYLQGLSKQSFVIGNNQFVIGDDRADFLEDLLTKGIQGFNLTFFHQYYPGHLWQLMRGSNITENALHNFSIKINTLQGKYNEDLGINSAEVYHIMEHLKSRERTGLRTFPSIAIVCNTVQQRNFISKAILDIKRSGSEEEKNDFLQMERNGLMVLHLGELAAYRFDVLLYSFTYDGATDHSHSLNTPAGLRQLNELMAVGKSEVQIIHCLPASLLDQWSEDATQEGFFLFSNYVKMLEAIWQGSAESQRNLSERLEKQYHQSDAPPQSTPFYDEIAARLAYFLPEARIIRHFQQANVRFPLVIEHEDYPGQKIAVISDYFISDYRSTNISWENDQRKKYANLGIHCLPTYSLNWWKNPDQAAERLANVIVEKWEEEKSQ